MNSKSKIAYDFIFYVLRKLTTFLNILHRKEEHVPVNVHLYYYQRTNKRNMEWHHVDYDAQY